MLCRDCIAFVERNKKTEAKYRLTDRHFGVGIDIRLFTAIGYCLEHKTVRYELTRPGVSVECYPATCIKESENE